MTAGASKFSDKSRQNSVFFLNSAGQELVDLGVDESLLVPPSTPENLLKTKKFSPSVSVAYHPGRNVTLYARYAQGFRTGYNDFGLSTLFAQLALAGAGGDPSFITGEVRAEDIEAFELGAKGSFLDDRIYGEIALYRNDLSDTQQSSIVVEPDSGVASNITSNLGQARTQGVELLFRFNELFAKGLTVSLAGSLLEAEIRGDDGEPFFLNGQRLNSTPEIILSAMAAYRFDIGTSGLEGTLSGSVQYAGDRSLSQLGLAPIVGDAITRADARFEVAKDAWAAFVFIQNAFNEDGRVNPTVASEPGSSAYLGNVLLPFEGLIGNRIRPRSIGAGVKFDF